jgi:hypothetical protein
MLSDHYAGGLTERLIVHIITVDPANGRIEGVGKDAAVIQIGLSPSLPPLFRWPVEDEYWTIVRENGIWRLESKLADPDSVSPQSLDPGEALIQADNIFTTGGERLITSEQFPAGGVTGQILAKNSNADWDTEWITSTAGGGPVAIDSWHMVGTLGEPAFASGWIQYAGALGQVGFRKFPDGKVQLKGLVMSTGAHAANDVIFTLPVGYRPAELIIWDTGLTGTGVCRVDIQTDGRVMFVASSIAIGVNSYITFDGLDFDTQTVFQITSNFAQQLDSVHLVGGAGEPAFQGGWVNYDNGAAVPGTSAQRNAGFRKYPDGRVRLFGTVRSGTSGTTIFTLPVDYRPRGAVSGQIVSLVAGAAGGPAQIDVYANGSVVATNIGASNVSTYAYLDSVEFDTEGVSAYVAGAITPPVVSTFPVAPVDGMEILLRIPSTVGLWRLRYDATIGDAYKWVFLGGVPQYTGSSGGGTHGLPPNPAFTTWRKFASNRGPHWTVPFNGYYQVDAICDIGSSTSGVDVRLDFINGGTPGANVAGGLVFGHQGTFFNAGSANRVTASISDIGSALLTVGTDVSLGYLTSTIVTDTFDTCNLAGLIKSQPIRIG